VIGFDELPGAAYEAVVLEPVANRGLRHFPNPKQVLSQAFDPAKLRLREAVGELIACRRFLCGVIRG
jgi:hypothetical protein